MAARGAFFIRGRLAARSVDPSLARRDAIASRMEGIGDPRCRRYLDRLAVAGLILELRNLRKRPLLDRNRVGVNSMVPRFRQHRDRFN